MSLTTRLYSISLNAVAVLEEATKTVNVVSLECCVCTIVAYVHSYYVCTQSVKTEIQRRFTAKADETSGKENDNQLKGKF